MLLHHLIHNQALKVGFMVFIVGKNLDSFSFSVIFYRIRNTNYNAMLYSGLIPYIDIAKPIIVMFLGVIILESNTSFRCAFNNN